MNTNDPELNAQFVERYNLSQRPLKRKYTLCVIGVIVFYAIWDAYYLGLYHPLLWEICLTRIAITLPFLISLYVATLKENWCVRLDRWVLIVDISIGFSLLINIYQYAQIHYQASANAMFLFLVVTYLAPGFFWQQKVFAATLFSALFILQMADLQYDTLYIQNTAIYLVLFNVLCGLNSYAFDQKVRAHFYQTQYLRDIAGTDKLTGLSNRYQFEERLDDLLSQSRDSQVGLALAFVDIDWFKQYNDEYGHIRGDGCLVSVAKTLNTIIEHESDMVIRFGGEEFIIVRTQMNLNDTENWAGSICQCIEDLKLPHEASPFEVVTVSAGVAWYNPATFPRRGILMQSADQALYDAKHHGRNRFALTTVV